MTTIYSQQVSGDVLDVLFTSSARVAVLRPFLLDPRRAYYQRQIEAATGLPIRAVQRELERLSAIALLYRHEEGNRTYYQVDKEFALFTELRSMIMKTAPALDQLRGHCAVDESVRLAFFSRTEERVLLVTEGARRPALPAGLSYPVEVMVSDGFIRLVQEKSPTLEPFLVQGIDLLGRREDLIWRRIEAAGYSVPKGEGVP